ncbi:hypothetical protein AKJ16_DCAP02808 [Drosera capensis]
MGSAYANAVKAIHDDPLYEMIFLEMPDESKDRLGYCNGAMDDTHVDAHVPIDEQIPYRGKRIAAIQNVICACSFALQFTFVMVG